MSMMTNPDEISSDFQNWTPTLAKAVPEIGVDLDGAWKVSY